MLQKDQVEKDWNTKRAVMDRIKNVHIFAVREDE